MNWVALQAPGKVTMRRYSLVFASSALCFFLGSLSASAQDVKGASAAQSDPWYSPKRYNPVKLFKRGPKSANDQLASDGDMEAKLTHQLQVQGILPQARNLQDACSAFNGLAECVASLRVSHSLQIDFSCLKWDVTGGKAMGLHRSIDLLKPDSNARVEANNALKRAREDIKDASE